jgi:hypothetical protein
MNSDENNLPKATAKPQENCYGCAHFFITWDKQYPYGCRKMDFRSKRLPCEDVLEADGQRCLARETKIDAGHRQTPARAVDVEAKPSRDTKRSARLGSTLNVQI